MFQPFKQFAGVALVSFSLIGSEAMAQSSPREQPNVILVLVDDLGWRDLTCTGSDFYETPNIDRLAQGGMIFTRAYATCPVCSPSRASILTGKYPARVGVTQWIGGKSHGKLLDVDYLHYLPKTETTLATALRDGGYQTWHVGKWHLGSEAYYPQYQGFDVNIGGCELGSPPPPNRYWSPYQLPNLKCEREGEYLTDRLTDESIKLIENRDKTRPFFMNLWHYSVHTPLQAPSDLIRKYQEKAKRLGLDRRDAIAVGEEMEAESPPGRPLGRVKRRLFQSDPTYAAMVENLDSNIGRTLSALAREGIADNTIVIFTSDNGGLATAEGSPTCNLPLAEGKGWCYEGGNRVSLIVSWPKSVKPGQHDATPVTGTDFYPTLLEAAGLSARPQQHVDGVSLMPLLNGTGKINRDAIFWHYPHYSNQGGKPATAIVSGQWKLIEFFEDRRVELYDLSTDPGERNDLSKAEYAVANRLRTLLHQWQTEVSAKTPERNPDWKK